MVAAYKPLAVGFLVAAYKPLAVGFLSGGIYAADVKHEVEK